MTFKISGKMHRVIRAEQTIQVWKPEQWCAHQHLVASFEPFICWFQSLQVPVLVQFLKCSPTHTTSAFVFALRFNFQSINMHHTFLHTHFSHLAHAFAYLKHLFRFRLSKFQSINSACYVFHDKRLNCPAVICEHYAVK